MYIFKCAVSWAMPYVTQSHTYNQDGFTCHHQTFPSTPLCFLPSTPPFCPPVENTTEK